MQLGAAGLGVVEVAPGEDRDPAQPGGRGEVAELADDVGVGITDRPDSGGIGQEVASAVGQTDHGAAV